MRWNSNQKITTRTFPQNLEKYYTNFLLLKSLHLTCRIFLCPRVRSRHHLRIFAVVHDHVYEAFFLCFLIVHVHKSEEIWPDLLDYRHQQIQPSSFRCHQERNRVINPPLWVAVRLGVNETILVEYFYLFFSEWR